jgi:hypothetical protein
VNLNAVQTNATFSIAWIGQIVCSDLNLWQLTKSLGRCRWGSSLMLLLDLRIHGLMKKCLRLLILLLKGIEKVWRKETSIKDTTIE